MLTLSCASCSGRSQLRPERGPSPQAMHRRCGAPFSKEAQPRCDKMAISADECHHGSAPINKGCNPQCRGCLPRISCRAPNLAPCAIVHM